MVGDLSVNEEPINPTLTPTEVEIVKWLATSMSNKQIAKAINRSAETIKVHVACILNKLDSKTRTEAVVKSAKLNIV